LVIIGLAVLAQIYLFLRIRALIRSSIRPRPWKQLSLVFAGAAIAALFAANWHIMYTPIPWLNPPTAAQAVFFYAPAIWSFGSLFSALLLLIAQAAAGVRRLALWIYRPLAGHRPDDPANPDRRRFLQAGVGGLAAAPFLLSGYGAAYAGRNHLVEELALPFGCPLRVVQLSDVHAGIFMTRDQMRRYVDQVIALRPDLFVLTGDYISNSTRIGGAHLYVSRGIGTTFTPVRLNSPPEVTLFKLD
jgi:hypothetical protein